MKIEKGIPIPDHHFGRKPNPLYNSFEVGDSVWVATKKDANKVANALTTRKQKVTQRVEGNGFRVWRIA